MDRTGYGQHKAGALQKAKPRATKAAEYGSTGAVTHDRRSVEAK
jgi:hypothetical protein